MIVGHPSGWAPDDERWDDDAATVRFGPGPARTELIRPAPASPWWARRAVWVFAIVGLAATGLALVVTATAPPPTTTAAPTSDRAGPDREDRTQLDDESPQDRNDAARDDQGDHDDQEQHHHQGDETRPESCPSTPSTSGGDTVGLPVALLGGCVRGVHHDRATAALTIEGWGQFRFGEVGDWLVVGDWGCDDRPTPALYRPDSGLVYLFTTWPTDGPTHSDHVMDAEIVDGVPSVGRHDGCDRLVIDAGG